MMILSAVAVLLCAALFSVSFAKWETDGNSSVEASGSVGQFYVEYPEYVNESGVAIPVFDKDEYYLQVPQKNNAEVSDYYKFTPNGNNENKAEKVPIHSGTTVKIYKGTENSAESRVIAGFRDASVSGQFASVSDNSITFTQDGCYSFYYQYEQYHYIYVSRDGDLPGSEPSAPETPTVVKPERDLTKNSVIVHFNDGDIVFQMGQDIEGGTTYFHIWKEGGAGTTWPGLTMNKLATSTTNSNEITLNLDSTDITGIILNNYNGEKQTGDGATFFTEFFSGGIRPNYTYTIKLKKTTYWNDFTSGKSMTGTQLRTYFDDIDKTPATSGGSGGGSSGIEITPAEPDTTGATDFSEKLNADMPVRQAIMRGTNNGNIYSYSNYVCVSRKNSAATVNDNSICFVVFEIVDAEGNRIENNTTKVNDVIITRALTENDGNPTGGNVDVPPRLYGEENVKTLSDINYEEKSGIGVSNAVEKYYDNGMYCILFFGDNEQQYFALDITIVTEGDAGVFYLKATASNINHWQRYNPGYGEPYGFYLGGYINNVTLWDPRRTTKFTENHADLDPETDLTTSPTFNDNNGTNPYTVQYPNRPIDITLTVNLTKGSEVKAYMLGKNGYRYAYVAGSGQDPKDSPTEGRVAYMLPGRIVMPDELKQKFVANGVVMTNSYELNLVIPESGEYTFHYVGTMTLATGDIDSNGGVEGVTSAKFHPGNANFMVDTLYITTTATSSSHTVTFYDAKGGNALSSQTVAFGQTATRPADPTNGDKKFVGWYYETATGDEAQYDFGTVVSSDVSVYAKWADAVITYTVLYFNMTDATNDSRNPSQYLVTNGDVTLYEPTTVPSEKSFAGWTLGERGDPIDKITPSTVNGLTGTTIALYANFTDKKYTVTFDVNTANGGSGTNIVYTDKVAGDSIDKPTDPTPANDLYDFDGWYDAAIGGNKISLSSTVTVGGTVTYYAHYKAARYRIVLDTSSWPGANTDGFKYHIHAYRNSTGVTGTWATRPEMKPLGNNKYYCDLSEEGITGVIFTQDRADRVFTETDNADFSRYTVSSGVSSLKCGSTTTYTPSFNDIGFDSAKYNQIGLVFKDGVIVLNASYDSGWSATSRPTNIFMKDYVNGSDVNITPSGWPGDTINYNKFTDYSSFNMSQVVEINLTKNSNTWTSGINPKDYVTALQNGYTYHIKYTTFSKWY